MNKGRLSDFASYVNNRIDNTHLSASNYVGVDNLLQNKGGRVDSEYVPTVSNSIEYKVGDILIGNIRPYFKKIWLADRDGGCSADVLCIRPNKNVDSKYLYAYLSTDSFFDYDMAGSKGSKMPRGDKDHIMSYPVEIPITQKEIGELMACINEKMLNHNRVNIELESMAKTLYDYWFLQFEFPNEEGKPYKSSGGKMVYNEELKREIPEGWEIKTVGELVNVVLGGTPKTEKEEYWNGNINWLNSGEIAQFPIVESELKITEAGLNNSATEYMKKGTTVVSITGNIRTSILSIDSCANQSVIGLLENEILKKSFLHPLMKDAIDYYLKISTGNCQQHINKQTIKDTKLPLPPMEILNSYYIECEPIYDLISNNGIQSKELSSLRDWLLPMLMNGQVTFKGKSEEQA